MESEAHPSRMLSQLRRNMSLSKMDRLTTDGRDWLVAALDPFHDYERQLAGYPDADGSRTIVSTYTRVLDVHAPVGLAADATWDAHICTLPTFLDHFLQSHSSNRSGTLTYDGARVAPHRVGMVSVFTKAAGGTLFPNGTADDDSLANAQVISLPDTVTQSTARVIGLAYEVANTTAEMYRQGSVTSYRMTQRPQDMTFAINNTVTTTAGHMETCYLQSPPTTAEAASALNGTRTWEASKGVYAVSVQSSVENPLAVAESKLIGFAAGGVGTATWVHVNGYNTSIDCAAKRTPSASPAFTIPFNTTGSFFNGLSYQTTLRVTVRVIVEVAPSWTEPAMAALATPSAGLDDKALRMYAHATAMLPVAVPLGENAAGDWFKRILKIVGSLAVPVATAFGNPVVGVAVKTATDVVDAAIPRPRVKRTTTPANPAQPVGRRSRKSKAAK